MFIKISAPRLISNLKLSKRHNQRKSQLFIFLAALPFSRGGSMVVNKVVSDARKGLSTLSLKAYHEITYGKVSSQDSAGVRVAGKHGEAPHDDESNHFLFSQLCNMELKPNSNLNRLSMTKRSPLIFTTQQQKQHILSMQSSSAELNSWVDVFHKKPLTAKTQGINILTHISKAAEDFKAHLNKMGHKNAILLLDCGWGSMDIYLGSEAKSSLSPSHPRDTWRWGIKAEVWSDVMQLGYTPGRKRKLHLSVWDGEKKSSLLCPFCGNMLTADSIFHQSATLSAGRAFHHFSNCKVRCFLASQETLPPYKSVQQGCPTYLILV